MNRFFFFLPAFLLHCSVLFLTCFFSEYLGAFIFELWFSHYSSLCGGLTMGSSSGERLVILEDSFQMSK